MLLSLQRRYLTHLHDESCPSELHGHLYLRLCLHQCTDILPRSDPCRLCHHREVHFVGRGYYGHEHDQESNSSRPDYHHDNPTLHVDQDLHRLYQHRWSPRISHCSLRAPSDLLPQGLRPDHVSVLEIWMFLHWWFRSHWRLLLYLLLSHETFKR